MPRSKGGGILSTSGGLSTPLQHQSASLIFIFGCSHLTEVAIDSIAEMNRRPRTPALCSVRWRLSLGLLLALAGLTSPAPAGAQTMRGLGFLSRAGNPFSVATGISADGSTVVGDSLNASGSTEAFVGSNSPRTMTGLGFLSTANSTQSNATGVSADGSSVVGISFNADGFREGFVWNADTGTKTGVGFLSTAVYSESWTTGISADGSTVVGYSGNADGFTEAFVWRASTGTMTGLGFLSTADYQHSYATGVSADGSTVVGSSRKADGTYEAFVWTAGTGMMGLGGLSPHYPSSGATGVSADGSKVVGYRNNNFGNYEAFVWTAGTGMMGLGFLPRATYSYSGANAISADGSTVVGYSANADGYLEACAWSANTGTMKGLGFLTGFPFGLSVATSVSADGSKVVGFSYNADGYQEAFIVKPKLTINVSIDVKPGSAVNPINLKSNGNIPVAILTTTKFDIHDVDPLTLLLGDPALTQGNNPSGNKVSPSKFAYEDVDADGDLDLILHFDQKTLLNARGLNSFSTRLSLTGETFDGDTVQGEDVVKIVTK